MKTCIPTINTYLYRFSVFASLLPIVLDACESIVSNPISHVWQIRSEQKINKYGKRLLHMQYSIVVFIHRTDAIRLQEKIYRHQTSQCDCLEYVHFYTESLQSTNAVSFQFWTRVGRHNQCRSMHIRWHIRLRQMRLFYCGSCTISGVSEKKNPSIAVVILCCRMWSMAHRPLLSPQRNRCLRLLPYYGTS